MLQPKNRDDILVNLAITVGPQVIAGKEARHKPGKSRRSSILTQVTKVAFFAKCHHVGEVLHPLAADTVEGVSFTLRGCA
jgi:hypothetical protein